MSRILLFNMDPEKAVKIRIAAYRLGLDCLEIPPEDQGRPLGALLGLPGFERAADPGDGFAEEMLLMETLSSELLDAMRASGASVALKAVVTEHNVGWSAAQLCRELRREHEAMQRLRPKPQNRHPRKKRK